MDKSNVDSEGWDAVERRAGRKRAVRIAVIFDNGKQAPVRVPAADEKEYEPTPAPPPTSTSGDQRE